MFNLIKIENARMNVPEPEYIEANVAITPGMPLIILDGKLAACPTTTKPEYISLGVAAVGARAQVARVTADQVYEAPISAAPDATLKIGAKVTIDAVNNGVTTTTTDGVATIVNLNGAAAAGDIVVVRFA